MKSRALLFRDIPSVKAVRGSRSAEKNTRPEIEYLGFSLVNNQHNRRVINERAADER